MPILKLSDTVRVEVIRDTISDGLFNHADVKFRFDQAWYYLLDFEADEDVNISVQRELLQMRKSKNY